MIFGQKVLRLRTVVSALLLLACLCFGGSASVPVYEMGLSIFALVCGLVVVWSSTSPKIKGPISWVIVAFVLLIAIQLIPLPDALWILMPQAQFAESLLPNSHLQGMSQSLSIVPEATLYSLIAAAPALIILWLVAGLSQSQRYLIANILILAVLCQAILGIAQAAGALTFTMYGYHHPKVAIGLFASRNHFADLVLMGTSLMFVVRPSWSRKYGIAVSEAIFHVFLLVFLLAIVGSASRAGLVLFALVVSIAYALSIQINYRLAFMATTTSLSAMLWVGLEFFPPTGIVRTSLMRFELKDEGRWDIWHSSLSVAREYGTLGVGLGSFRQAFEQFEPLHSVNLSYINAAHNEYIQLLIEMGMAGVLLTIICALTLSLSGWNNRHNRLTVFGSLGIIMIVVHSLIDYPFRSVCINVVLSCLVSFVISKSPNRKLFSNTSML